MVAMGRAQHCGEEGGHGRAFLAFRRPARDAQRHLVGKISDENGAREGGSGKRSSGIFLVLHNQFFALLLLPSSLPVPSSSSFFLGFPPPHLGLHGIELAQHPFEFGDVVGEVVDVVLRDLVVGDVDRL